ncbi:MAG: hypothetical protein JWL90_1510 [Chthoniobacteraceae bacterium]|nr:hypothetical protein [Chthoniobacteraceae bacterium]MDB6173359.1 hypothetical protein [Chthoniobacteraceae bacterium]
MHRTHPPQGVRRLAFLLKRQARRGFSLIEITLSLGIIAFAFVALFGLLPMGLSVFRTSVDAANEMWIMQDLNTMVQVTEWPQIKKLNFADSGEIYYYDEEGRLVDSEKNPSQDPTVPFKRLYAVKLVVDDFSRPNASSSEGSADILLNTLRVIAVFAPKGSPPAMVDFASITTADSISMLKKNTAVKIRTFLVARMDSEKAGT